MRIFVLGNSHVGALKLGWDEIAGFYPEVRITFFAHRADRLGKLVVRDGKLFPKNRDLKNAIAHTSGGSREIDPAKCDVILIYGLGAKAYFSDPNRYFSESVKSEAMTDHASDTISYEIFRMIREVTEKQVYIGHAPLRAATKHVNRLQEGFPKPYELGIRDINEYFYRPQGAELVPQPQQTIINSRHTDPRFSLSSKRLDIGDELDHAPHPENDRNHMNHEFGKLWLQMFLELIANHPTDLSVA